MNCLSCSVRRGWMKADHRTSLAMAYLESSAESKLACRTPGDFFLCHVGGRADRHQDAHAVVGLVRHDEHRLVFDGELPDAFTRRLHLRIETGDDLAPCGRGSWSLRHSQMALPCGGAVSGAGSSDWAYGAGAVLSNTTADAKTAAANRTKFLFMMKLLPVTAPWPSGVREPLCIRTV